MTKEKLKISPRIAWTLVVIISTLLWLGVIVGFIYVF